MICDGFYNDFKCAPRTRFIINKKVISRSDNTSKYDRPIKNFLREFYSMRLNVILCFFSLLSANVCSHCVLLVSLSLSTYYLGRWLVCILHFPSFQIFSIVILFIPFLSKRWHSSKRNVQLRIHHLSS